MASTTFVPLIVKINGRKTIDERCQQDLEARFQLFLARNHSAHLSIENSLAVEKEVELRQAMLGNVTYFCVLLNRENVPMTKNEMERKMVLPYLKGGAAIKEIQYVQVDDERNLAQTMIARFAGDANPKRVLILSPTSFNNSFEDLSHRCLPLRRRAWTWGCNDE